MAVIILLVSCVDTLFPAEAFYEWLTYAHGKDNSIHEDFRKRELSMTLEGDLYIRYQGYSNAVCVKRLIEL